MLDSIFGSKTRVKILKLFLLNPNQKYYIRQLARDLDLQVNSIRRELENLESFGLLVSSIGKENKVLKNDIISSMDDIQNSKDEKGIDQDVKNNKKEFQISGLKKSINSDRQSKKYYQVDKTFILFEELKALLVKSQVLYQKDFSKKVQKLGKIDLLVLTGFFVDDANSEVDILIVGNINRNKLLNAISDLEKEVRKEINFTLMDKAEFLYRRSIADVFLHEVLTKKKIVVIDTLSDGK